MDVVATNRTLPHNLEAERSVLGAIDAGRGGIEGGNDFGGALGRD